MLDHWHMHFNAGRCFGAIKSLLQFWLLLKFDKPARVTAHIDCNSLTKDRNVLWNL